MKIGKWIAILFTVLLVSMFFFPLQFKGFLSQNTKNLMAALGLVFMVATFVYKGNLIIPKEVIILLFLSGIVSIVSYISVVYNQTPDYSYVTYIRAAIIWLSAAYVVAVAIRLVHGYIDAKLVVNYLVAVCVFQCVMSILIEFVPAVQNFVDSYVEQGQDVLKDMGRIYGLGASLDVAGSRFAVVLVAIAGVIDSELQQMKMREIILYGAAFVIITIIGNIISRTTIVGDILAILLLVFRYFQGVLRGGVESFGKLIWSMIVVLLIFIPTSVALYRSFPAFQELMEFGFEGFFSFFKEGEFETSSTNTLMSMVVFPEDIDTWIIGDGYFENSRNDVNYLGDATTDGFYMGTDIGYLRFIFYGGIILLLAISAVIVYAAVFCMNRIPDYKVVFILALAVNFIVWLKVATDIFLFFSLFIAAFIIYETLGDSEMEYEDDDEDDLLDEGEYEEDDEEDEEEPEKVPVFPYRGLGTQ